MMSSRRRVAAKLPQEDGGDNKNDNGQTSPTTMVPASSTSAVAAGSSQRVRSSVTVRIMMGLMLTSCLLFMSSTFQPSTLPIDSNISNANLEQQQQQQKIRAPTKTGTSKSTKTTTTTKKTSVTKPKQDIVNRHALTVQEADFVYGSRSSPTEKTSIKIYMSTNCTGFYIEFKEVDFGGSLGGINLCETSWNSKKEENNKKHFNKSISQHFKKHGGSIIVESGGASSQSNTMVVDLYGNCMAAGTEFDRNKYLATVFPLDGCTKLHAASQTPQHIKLVPSTLADPSYQPKYTDEAQQPNKKTYHGAISVESSTYFYYQVLAGLHSWETTGNSKKGRFTRLLSSSEPDDITHLVPTFTAPRHLESWFYRPLNKADSLVKWFASPSSPKEDVIVVMDADNWFTKDLSPLVQQVKPGHALGNRAFYTGQNKKMMQLWHEICAQPHNMTACDQQLTAPVALAAVPYFVHRDDLRMIAPRWKKSIIELHQRVRTDKAFEKRYDNFQISWCVEMLAYNFAAAEAGVQHTLHEFQRRDVEMQLYPYDMRAKPEKRTQHLQLMNDMYMIHMGRAWFPHEYTPGKQWEHTEGQQFSNMGTQVWCKCNFTAASIIPWPLPPKIDYVSNVTLTLLHDVKEKYGLIPTSKYRKQGQNSSAPTKDFYYYPYP